MKSFSEYLKPVIVLLAVCVAAGLVLSGVNAMTKDTIAANEEAARTANYFLALPEADSFTAGTASNGADVQTADNGAGIVIAASSRGYGGDVTAYVAFSNDGEILNTVINSSSETPGMGSKVSGEDFTDNFTGQAAKTFVLEEIDAVTGATISSKAALAAVNKAVEAFEEIRG